MNQLTLPGPAHAEDSDTILEEVGMEAAADGELVGWELKKLRPMHRQICALIAAGQKYVNIAPIVGCTPEYISMLMRQPIIKTEVDRLSDVAMTRLKALTEQSVEVIGTTLRDGSEKGKLQAARLVLEGTGRLGRGAGGGAEAPADMADRLLQLSERLVQMNSQRPRKVFNSDGEEITDVPTGPSA